ncbi:flagellar hook-length control protein FliK [Phytopseudomonas dryadis]|uniref:Flagellar hook-length control protein FliK n=1 Tax=Phytopseudomonas dryadis TaxID=2487520 RepID=A0A4V2KCL2_9GAMM|nr:flagellar hook-length control protein FliK [Pseudomonas dryadis]TBU95402.1 flagellar hook-length control protein FliK [Pseudomonas dryadis]
MSVAPDLLLTSTPAAKPKAATAKATQDTAEPRRKEASSFSQVYAKERQANKPAERNDGSARPARDSKSEAKSSEQTDAARQVPAVADTGKPLPADANADPASEEAGTDAFLLLGMFAQPPVEVDTAELEVGTETAPSANLLGSGPASLTEASFDPEIDALNQLPAVRMALDLGAQARAAEQVATGSASANAGQTFASAMAALGLNASNTPSEAGETLELPLKALSAEGLEALKESSADTPPENFVSKLSALSQAIGQQSAQVARAPVVPGQPVAMQQAGWSEAVVDKVMWLSSQNLKSAEIQLDPAELGRLDVRISLNQDQTQISFASAHAGVREALESQVHRLREMFTQQGMNLLDVNVSDQSQGRAWQGQDGDGRNRGGLLADDADAGGTLEEERLVGSVELKDNAQGGGRGMVDYYA